MKLPVTDTKDSAQSERVVTLAVTLVSPSWSVRVSEGEEVCRTVHVNRRGGRGEEEGGRGRGGEREGGEGKEGKRKGYSPP